MAAAFRGPAAFWAGGASASAATLGFRSPAALWLGGATARPASAAARGFRGMLAFWLGGASANPSITPPAVVFHGGARPHRQPVSPVPAQRLREDEELAVILAAAFRTMLEGQPNER